MGGAARQGAGGSTGHRGTPEHTHPDDLPVQTALATLADPVRLSLVRELAGSAVVPQLREFRRVRREGRLKHHFAVESDG